MIKEEFYLGIDVGKYQHQATLINQEKNIIGHSFKFTNEQTGFNYLSATIKKQLPPRAVVKVGMEATGHYYWHLKDYFIRQGLAVKVFNPIETQIRAKTKIRKVKNDRLDSLLIAELTSQKQFMPISTEKKSLRELKELARFCEKLKSQSRFYKQEISTLLERLCPEYSRYLPNTFLKTSLMIIKSYFLTQTPQEELKEKIVKISRGRIKTCQAQEIITMLDNSLGTNYRQKISQLQLHILLESLTLIEKQILAVKDQLKKLANQFQEIEYLSSIKGISEYSASIILAEV